jgi:hypothetical protein
MTEIVEAIGLKFVSKDHQVYHAEQEDSVGRSSL